MHHKKLIKTLWILFYIVVFIVPLYIFTVKINLCNLYGGIPSMAVLENPQSDLASELYSADGKLLGKYFRNNRSPVTYEDLSIHLVNALLATEDFRFYQHSGIDLQGLLRALFLSIIFQQNKGGGSTLTQQLAKNLFQIRTAKNYNGKLHKIPFIKKLVHKTKEWIVAVQLERAYTKKEIIAMYLNTVFFGSNAYGIKVAARVFFNTTPDALRVEQAAVLIGLLKGPTYYSPVKHINRAKDRRNVVLTQLLKYKFLTQTAYNYLSETPLELNYKIDDHNEGMATYFRAISRVFLLKWAQKNGYDLFADGLKIYTTIDSRLQQHAESAVKEHMSSLQKKFEREWAGQNPWVDEEGKELDDFIPNEAKKTALYKQLVEKYGEDSDAMDLVMNTPVSTKLFSWEKGTVDTLISPIEVIKYNQKILQTGFMAMDPHTGDVKAWVGGINYKYFQYDHVMQGKRQPGSAFKPFIYTVALANGYKPDDKILDAPVTFTLSNGNTWTPKNAWDQYSGLKVALRYAMVRSMNSVTAYLMKEFTPHAVVDCAKRMGITSPLAPVPSLCLGASDVSVYDLVGAYSTFVNKGVWTSPLYITRIEDKNGHVLERFLYQRREAINEKTAQLMLDMLKFSNDPRDGALKGVSKKITEDNEIVCKTGTSSNHSDGWAIALTKNLCTGVWVGGDHRCIHFKTLGTGRGSTTARPLWEKFMLKIYEDPNLPYEKGPLLTLSKSQRVNQKKQKNISDSNVKNEENNLQESSIVKKKKKIKFDLEGML